MSQRLRITFSTTGPMRYVAHLDTMRTWERAIRRAQLPLVYTSGFSPHARMALAAPLPVGVEGLNELMDIWLEPAVDPAAAVKALVAALPPGLAIVEAEAVSDALPSLQSCLRAARYEARLPAADGLSAVRAQVQRLLALDTLDWEEERGEKTRRYDLRATILDLGARADGAEVVLELYLSLEVGRTGRPTQVLRAMDLDADGVAVVRLALELDAGAVSPGAVAAAKLPGRARL